MLLALILLVIQPVQAAEAIRVLYFGDSHSVATYGPFGMAMNNTLRELPGASVTTHARCGSVLSWWYSGKATTCGYYDEDRANNVVPKLRPADSDHPKPYYPNNAPTPKIIPIIEMLRPQMIVVEMGGNYLLANDPVGDIKKEVGIFIADLETYKLANHLGSNFSCVWFGPPAHRIPSDPNAAIAFKKRMADIVSTIKNLVESSCEFVDGTLFTTYPAVGGDGTHYSFPDGKKAAQPWIEKANEVVKAQYSKLTNVP